jgi:hypothetical protein
VGSQGSRSGGEAAPKWSQLERQLILRPAAITHRDIAAWALLIASGLALDGGPGCINQRRFLEPFSQRRLT